MKKLSFCVFAVFIACTGASAQSGFPAGVERSVYFSQTRASSWSGFYAGLNIGYGWGTTVGAPVTPVPFSDNFFAFASNVCPLVNGPCIPNGLYGATSLANAGVAAVNQNGVIGGGQMGYNWQITPNFLIGVEADIQGADIQGSGGFLGASSDFYTDQQPITLKRAAVGQTTVRAGVDWLGGLRGRVGYIVSPAWLLYAAGGLAYGGVHASSSQHFSMLHDWIPVPGFPPLATTYPTLPGNGQFSSTRVGWAAGGGLEWMAGTNWSLKVETLYYNLGGASFASSAAVALDPTGNWGVAGGALAVNAFRTQVKYDGVIARVGLNYHLNWGAPSSPGI